MNGSENARFGSDCRPQEGAGTTLVEATGIFVGPAWDCAARRRQYSRRMKVCTGGVAPCQDSGLLFYFEIGQKTTGHAILVATADKSTKAECSKAECSQASLDIPLICGTVKCSQNSLNDLQFIGPRAEISGITPGVTGIDKSGPDQPSQVISNFPFVVEMSRACPAATRSRAKPFRTTPSL
jgi:hypothetical protein